MCLYLKSEGLISCKKYIFFNNQKNIHTDSIYKYLGCLLSLQFLPIYTPSEEEKKNPALFAINVRRVMAK